MSDIDIVVYWPEAGGGRVHWGQCWCVASLATLPAAAAHLSAYPAPSCSLHTTN